MAENSLESSEESSQKVHVRWTPSTSSNMSPTSPNEETNHIVAQELCHVEPPSMLGFSSFLIAVKSVSFITYLVLLLVADFLFDPSFFWTILAFGIAEFVLITITVYHGVQPTLKVVFVMLGLEMTLSLVKMIFAIILMAVDGGKDCRGDDHCSIIFISNNERFGLFFFILSSAFIDGLIALLTIANSPQMHEFEMGDEYLF